MNDGRCTRRYDVTSATATLIETNSLLEACPCELCDCTQRLLRGIQPKPKIII
jgi:hypothetical protein